VEIHESPYQPTGCEMVGPFQHTEYKVVADGYVLPYMTAYPLNAQNTEWDILVDGRFAYRLPQEVLDQVIPLLADVMAITAGYKSHANACQHQQDRNNPFGTRMLSLTALVNDEQTDDQPE